MNINHMIVVYGAPAAGKSTLTEYLRSKRIDVIELDEEIMKENDGIWPTDPTYRNREIVPKVLTRVALVNRGIFITSAINEPFVQTVRKNGGKLLLLQLPHQQLIDRDKTRDQSAADQIEQNLQDQQRYAKTIGYDDTLDASRPVDQIAAQLLHLT